VCTREEICAGKASSWRVDESRSLENLVVDFDLLCESKWSVGLLGSCLYVGEFAASLALSLLSFNSRIKLLRQRNYLLLGTLVYLLFCSRTQVHAYMASFVLGLCLALFIVHGYSYMIELTPFAQRNSVGTAILAIDKLVLIFSIVFLKYFNNQWRPLVGMGLVFAFISLILGWYLPDSPQLHYDKGNYKEAKRIFRQLKLKNTGQDMDDFDFDKEEMEVTEVSFLADYEKP